MVKLDQLEKLLAGFGRQVTSSVGALLSVVLLGPFRVLYSLIIALRDITFLLADPWINTIDQSDLFSS